MPAIARVGGPGASQPFVRIPPADGTRSTSTSSSTIISVEYPASVSTTASSRASVQDCRCGAPYIPGAKFCSECGAKVALCSCGTAFAPGAKFCSECGAKRCVAATKDFRLSDDSTDSESETISYGDITEVYAFDSSRLPEANSRPCMDLRHQEQDAARLDEVTPQHRSGPPTECSHSKPEQGESRLGRQTSHEVNSRPSTVCSSRKYPEQDMARLDKVTPQCTSGPSTELSHREPEQGESRNSPEVRSEPRRKCKERRGARDGLQESCALSNLKQSERDLPIASVVERDPRRRQKEMRGFADASKEALGSTLESFSRKTNKLQSSLPHSVHEALKRPEKNRSGTPVPTGQRASVLNVQPLESKRQSGYTRAVDGATLFDHGSGGRGQLATVPGGWDLGSFRTKKRPVRT